MRMWKVGGERVRGGIGKGKEEEIGGGGKRRESGRGKWTGKGKGVWEVKGGRERVEGEEWINVEGKEEGRVI